MTIDNVTCNNIINYYTGGFLNALSGGTSQIFLTITNSVLFNVYAAQGSIITRESAGASPDFIRLENISISQNNDEIS